MSKKARVTEKSTTVETREGDNTKTCDGCGAKQKFWNIIDDWAIADGKYYCRSCQKKMGIGWYRKK